MNFFLDSALLGLEYALLAVGVYITFRILNLPDLTVDGSFTFGMAVSTVLCAAAHPFAGLLAGALAGAAAGVVTGFLQTHCKIHPILAGILTMSGLYTVNITVLGGPNVSLLDAPKFFEVLGGKAPAVGLVTVVVVVLVTLFFQTVGGLCIRAAGSNEDMVRASSINTTAVRWAALALANALVALSGAILAQCQGFGDVGAGSGMIVIGTRVRHHRRGHLRQARHRDRHRQCGARLGRLPHHHRARAALQSDERELAQAALGAHRCGDARRTGSGRSDPCRP